MIIIYNKKSPKKPYIKGDLGDWFLGYAVKLTSVMKKIIILFFIVIKVKKYSLYYFNIFNFNIILRLNP